MTKLWFLRRLDLFEGMSEIEMERLGALLRMRSCRTGQDVVVRPSGDRIYVVKSGRVRVLQGDVAVAVLGPGQLFGTSALFGAVATNQRVVAVDDVLVCDAPAAQFLGAMATHPRLAAKVAMILARQLFELEQAVERSVSDPASARLAELLLRVAKGAGGTPVVDGMSQADLASMIGTSRETVSRLIAEWERKGIVRNRPRLIEVADEPALRRLAS
ncbi:MAG TPA: Crp/Fnr family transcriptional regulator [Candidatus Limnocylindria bacterium]|jgi:CRP/FNR family transcriptional regulator|nr:Crp/Fnr family transcriptional regulator [Candidatus Limnocylindria bacterium]